MAEALVKHLKAVPGVAEAIVAGSYRRRKETVGDLDVLVTCREAFRVMDAFTSYEDVSRVIAQGDTKSAVVLRNGLQVDLRVVPQESYGAALHYFTGSKAHNIAVRHLGVQRGLKINEYGVFRGEARLAGRTEAEVFAAVDLPWIEPELREDWGEIAAAQAGPAARSSSPWPTSGATSTPTPRPPTAATAWRRWPRPPRSGATNIWPSPTTRNG